MKRLLTIFLLALPCLCASALTVDAPPFLSHPFLSHHLVGEYDVEPENTIKAVGIYQESLG
jgi:hypothetical protein